MQDTPGIPRFSLRESPHRTPVAEKYRAAFVLSLFLALFLVGRLCLAAETEESVEHEKQAINKSAETVEIDLRQEQIQYLADEILEDMRKDDALTPDTLFLKSGIQLNCAILSETVSHYTISYNGLETIFPKGKVTRVESRSQESVDEELHATALAKATRIVDYGLVRYGNEWILPDEKAYRMMKAQMRSEAKRIEATVQTEIAKAEDKAKLARPDEGIRAPITVGGDYGPEIFVEVTLVGKGTSIDITMLLDTGAAITCIHPNVADELELVEVGKATITMADGRGSPYPVVRLEEIAIQGVSARGIFAFVADCGPSSAQGLLGSDFLRHFEFKINPEREIMFLKPR